MFHLLGLQDKRTYSKVYFMDRSMLYENRIDQMQLHELFHNPRVRPCLSHQ
jgi:hypothetical protein